MLSVHQPDEHIGDDVARAPAAPPLRRGNESQLAPYRVKGAVAVRILAVGGAKGPEQPLAVTVGTVSVYLGERVHLEIQGMRTIGKHVVLERAVGDWNPVEAFWEQFDCWCR